MVYLLVLLPFIGWYLGGIYCFLTFYIIFAGVPLVDYWIRDPSNPKEEDEHKLLIDPYFEGITLAYLPVQIFSLTAALYIVSTQTMTVIEWLGFCTSIGLVTGGVGITLAHELMHKNTRYQQVVSRIILVMVCYGHFIIEHVRGHHVRVATPQDPASARLGESIYHFLPRSIFGSFKSAWHLECRRLKQRQLPVFSCYNQFWWIISAPVIITILCYMLGGLSCALFFLLQSFIAILTLEIVNYIEHYGLQRKKLENGRYERVSPCHSWNANHWLSNMLLFHLQRHSDHHTYGARPYQILKHMEESPQLPSGYIGMIFIALFPPLWRAVMDKRVISYQQHLPENIGSGDIWEQESKIELN